MKRFVLILHNKAHNIIESETKPIYPPDSQGNPVVLIDITDKPQVQEGWEYNSITDEFVEPEIPVVEPTTTPIEPNPIDELALDNLAIMMALAEINTKLDGGI